MSDRLSRKDIKHDKFIEEVGTAYSYVEHNRRPVILAIGAVIVLLLAGWGFVAWRAARENKAQLALSDAIKTADAPVNPPAGSTPPPPVSFKTEDERTAKATAMFQSVADDYSGTDAADVAQLYLARYAMAKGDAAAAKQKLQDFVGEHGDHILAAGARVSLYELRISGGEAQQVATELEKMIADSDESLPTDTILYLLGRSYEAAGNRDKARGAWQRLSTEFPESAYASDAQQKL